VTGKVGESRNGHTGAWPEHKVELLKKLWAEGMFARDIARRVGAPSKMAVIGKARRLGLAERGPTGFSSAWKKHRRGEKRQPKSRRDPRENITAVPRVARPPNFRAEPLPVCAEELVIPPNERKYIQTLTETCCRWPIGDPQQADFHFCGKRKITGLSYCEVHARRAFQPPQGRIRPPKTFGGPMGATRIDALREFESA
jgi:GcrA cell cycle regulator